MREAIGRREFTAADLIEAQLRQIAEVNPRINAFAQLYADRAMNEARQVDQRIAKGEDPGPLAGIPVTLKDSFDISGEPTWCGSRYRLGHRATADATCVQRLRSAGAIILGKTNCPEFLMNWETDNAITGQTRNPLNPKLTPGGSSGGESAAIAAFCSAGGIGSDGGGSIRFPAHCTGICGLKPTPGRVPATGHFPEISHPGGLLGVAGPMARTVEDLEILFRVVAGHDPQDPFSAPVAISDSPEVRRIGVMEQFFDTPVDHQIRAAVRKAAALLDTRGYSVNEFSHPPLRSAPDLWWFFFGRINAPLIRTAVGPDEEKAHWTGVEILHLAEQDPPPTCDELLASLAQRDRLRASLLKRMEDTPVLLLPVCSVPAFAHRRRQWQVEGQTLNLRQIIEPMTPWNLLGLPALAIPFGETAEGVPISIQLVGRPWEEQALLTVAEQLVS